MGAQLLSLVLPHPSSTSFPVGGSAYSSSRRKPPMSIGFLFPLCVRCQAGQFSRRGKSLTEGEAGVSDVSDRQRVRDGRRNPSGGQHGLRTSTSRGPREGRSGEFPVRNDRRNESASSHPKNSVRIRTGLEVEDVFPRRDPVGGNLRRAKGLRREALGVLDYVGVKVDTFSDLGDKDDEELGQDVEPSQGEDVSLNLVDGESKPLPPRGSSMKSDYYLTEARFDECPISPLSLKGVKAAGFEKMTVVQKETLPFILRGKDILAKAKTGTGKTVAFLLPAIEIIVKLPPPDHGTKSPPINVLVICPTRELACQAATEANTLLKFHASIGVQVVIGGTRLTLEQKRMQANSCQILVATPGRLRDHIENSPGFAVRLKGVKVLVLDEADHLLDMGFRKAIENIIAALPKQRQTLLFSATIPQEVRHICHIALKRDHEFVNTVEEGTEETHSQVRQMHLIAPLDKQFSCIYSILKEHIVEDVDYKILVFCTTAMVTRLVAELLSQLNLNVREIHSRKSQSYRTKVSDEFRKSKGLILVTSDVSARGVDYPDVTLVIQVGLPSDREQYIHRLGRTGRTGKEGKGVLLLAPWEEFFLSTISDLPMSSYPLPTADNETRKKVHQALSLVEMKTKESAYQAWLGYYNSNKDVGRDKIRLVELANDFSRSMGLDNPPAIPNLILGKMGLRNVPGLRSK